MVSNWSRSSFGASIKPLQGRYLVQHAMEPTLSDATLFQYFLPSSLMSWASLIWECPRGLTVPLGYQYSTYTVHPLTAVYNYVWSRLLRIKVIRRRQTNRKVSREHQCSLFLIKSGVFIIRYDYAGTSL